ncbi:putative nuclease HARBI1 [Pleurodeles waltl]|uniref:putative nuclease HARBI1 n=1 Tax=Pleurodeles waltl TaxID=8319 RepID=UPI0037093ADA
MDLVRLLEPDLRPGIHHPNALMPTVQVLAILDFLASGSFQITVGWAAGMFQPMFSNVLNVLYALLKHIGSHTRFPQRDDLPTVKAAFYVVAHVPHVIGAIDGTHIVLVAPRRSEQVFRNHKIFYSTNVMVCLADLYIIQVTARSPGSVHDAYILWNSSIPHLTAPLQRDRAWLIGMYRVICVPLYSAYSTPSLRFTTVFNMPVTSVHTGDSGYPNKPCLLTPLRHLTTAAEDHFNEAHGRTLRVIKRTFGVLKARFRSLHLTGGALLYRAAKVCQIIVACCMSDNLAIRRHPLLDAEEGAAVPVADEGDMGSDEKDDEDAADSRAELI